jgi:hypothetical protein
VVIASFSFIVLVTSYVKMLLYRMIGKSLPFEVSISGVWRIRKGKYFEHIFTFFIGNNQAETEIGLLLKNSL